MSARGADVPIRLVAVDMDGTFLRSDHTFDRPRFWRVLNRMRERDCRFVVASGNQYEQLRSFFGEAADDFAYVAENGAHVRDRDEALFVARLGKDIALHVVEVLTAVPGLEFVASGPNGAFVLDGMSQAFYEKMAFYYPRIRRVASLATEAGDLFKFCLDYPDGVTDSLVDWLHSELGAGIEPVTSGRDSLDLIVPGCHKASGLQRLLDRWGLAPAECAAFGDSDNDIEMIDLCGYGTAMANSSPRVLDKAKWLAPSNDDDGVLVVLESWLHT